MDNLPSTEPKQTSNLLSDQSPRRTITYSLASEDEILSNSLQSRIHEMSKLSHPGLMGATGYSIQEDKLILEFPSPALQRLSDYLGIPISEQDAAWLLIPLVDALSHAHHQNILHGNITPDSILITSDGNLMLDETGLAELQSQIEPVHRSLIYAAPELQQGQLDHRSDIYSIGIMLFEMIFGKAPFQSKIPAELLWMHREQPVPSVFRNKCASVPMLEILQKTLAKNPDDRYQDLNELKRHLMNFINNPIRESSPVLSISGILASAVTLALIAGLIYLLSIINPLIQPASGVSYLSPTTQNQQFIPTTPTPSTTLVGYSTPTITVTPTKSPVPTKTPTPTIFTDIIRPSNAKSLILEERWYIGEPVKDIAISPEGDLFAAALTEYVRVWDIGTGKVAYQILNDASTIAFSPDNLILATGGPDRAVRLWQAWDGRAKRALTGHTGPVLDLAFSPDSQRLYSGGSYSDIVAERDTGLRAWNVADGKLIETWEVRVCNALAVSKDESHLASASAADLWPDGANNLQFWLISQENITRNLDESTSTIFSLAFSPDDRILASGSWDTTVRFWNYVEENLNETLRGHQDSVYTVVFSPDGKLLASGSADTTIKLWNVENSSLITTLEGHTDSVNSLVFTPNGKSLISGSSDGTIRFWTLAK